MASQRRSRRSMLRAGLLGGGTLLSGCMGRSDHFAGQNEATTATPTGVFESISFDGQDLVVHLQGDHDVSQVNLIAPNGTAFAEQPVATGATTVRIQILDMRFGIAGYEHYTPGEYELVAVSADETVSISLTLEPDLRVVDIRQYRDGDDPLDLGRVEVEIENVGSGPTWIHDITYRNAPNWTANDALSGQPGVPHVGKANSPSDIILIPDDGRTFIDNTAPFLFDEESSPACSSEHEFTVIIGPAVGSPLETRITSVIDGEPTPATISGDFTCSRVEIERADSDGSETEQQFKESSE